MFLLKIINKLEEHHIDYALVGGHAVALHGAVRGTFDIDFITKWTLKNLSSIETALSELGLQSRLPIKAIDLFHFKDEYIRNRNLIAWNFINLENPIEQIDVVLNLDLSQVKIKRVKVKNQSINIISKKDLIQMKKISGRKQDLIDVEALEKLDEN